MRAGDTVKHLASGETWILANDPENWRVSWAGWPPGMADEKDCELVKSATDAERIDMLERVSKMKNDERGNPDHRQLCAVRQLGGARG